MKNGEWRIQITSKESSSYSVTLLLCRGDIILRPLRTYYMLSAGYYFFKSSVYLIKSSIFFWCSFISSIMVKFAALYVSSLLLFYALQYPTNWKMFILLLSIVHWLKLVLFRCCGDICSNFSVLFSVLWVI